MSAESPCFPAGNHEDAAAKRESADREAAHPPLACLRSRATDESSRPDAVRQIYNYDVNFPRCIYFSHALPPTSSFYSQLIRHIATPCYLLLSVASPPVHALGQIPPPRSYAASTADCLPVCLPPVLPRLFCAAGPRQLAVAFALVLGRGEWASLSSLSAYVIGIDPRMDGMGREADGARPSSPTCPASFAMEAAAMWCLGSASGNSPGAFLCSACAPAGSTTTSSELRAECCPPSCYLVAGEYGHVGYACDAPPGLRGIEGDPFGVAFLRAFLEGDPRDAPGF
ncbi:unnamed protein product [Spirodela intermedia]|uniref:Uncharacterized protein n=1 Tax=Spirodela intermedia TaxID=51605 RepID=A0A7I8IKU2_SPIIN|nr:unnamed protein product [Spirodela intermedia]CAA2618779.1 unnamed protein product [Spirodela intermedia]CAA6658498.1 unnamed protein product [Spirodela intermedia]CAA6658501.1 unnamed protein product [Spirodela intermedia]